MNMQSNTVTHGMVCKLCNIKLTELKLGCKA